MIAQQNTPYCIDTIGSINIAPKVSINTVMGLWHETLKVTSIWAATTFVAAGAALYRGIERYRQRKALAQLDDRLLEDIGLTREAVRREISKPMWSK